MIPKAKGWGSSVSRSRGGLAAPGPTRQKRQCHRIRSVNSLNVVEASQGPRRRPSLKNGRPRDASGGGRARARAARARGSGGSGGRRASARVVSPRGRAGGAACGTRTARAGGRARDSAAWARGHDGCICRVWQPPAPSFNSAPLGAFKNVGLVLCVESRPPSHRPMGASF